MGLRPSPTARTLRDGPRQSPAPLCAACTSRDKHLRGRVAEFLSLLAGQRYQHGPLNTSESSSHELGTGNHKIGFPEFSESARAICAPAGTAAMSGRGDYHGVRSGEKRKAESDEAALGVAPKLPKTRAEKDTYASPPRPRPTARKPAEPLPINRRAQRRGLRVRAPREFAHTCVSCADTCGACSPPHRCDRLIVVLEKASLETVKVGNKYEVRLRQPRGAHGDCAPRPDSDAAPSARMLTCVCACARARVFVPVHV